MNGANLCLDRDRDDPDPGAGTGALERVAAVPGVLGGLGRERDGDADDLLLQKRL